MSRDKAVATLHMPKLVAIGNKNDTMLRMLRVAPITYQGWHLSSAPIWSF